MRRHAPLRWPTTQPPQVRDDGIVHLVGTAGTRELPLRYAVPNVELAYASTAYGAHGADAGRGPGASGGRLELPRRAPGRARGVRRPDARLTQREAKLYPEWIDNDRR